MKTSIEHFKKILKEDKDDLIYLLLVGVPFGIFAIWLSQFMDYSHLF